MRFYSFLAFSHCTTKKVGFMQNMPIPDVPFQSIAVDIFHYLKVKRDSVV